VFLDGIYGFTVPLYHNEDTKILKLLNFYLNLDESSLQGALGLQKQHRVDFFGQASHNPPPFPCHLPNKVCFHPKRVCFFHPFFEEISGCAPAEP
jgi:hypothetical protein